MADRQPLITLVKKGEIAPRPDLTPEDLALEQTLSMLCSFLSIEDFASFLKSKVFSSYAQREEAWLVMEVGLYHDHTKTLQLYPEEAHLTLADNAMTGAFADHVWKGQPDQLFITALSHWVAVVSGSQ